MFTYLEAWHSPLYLQASKAVSTLQRQASFLATPGSPTAQVRPAAPSAPPAALPQQLASPGPHLPLAPREPQRVGRAAGASTLSPLALAPTLPVPREATGGEGSPAPLPSGTLPFLGACMQTPVLSPSGPPPSASTHTYGADPWRPPRRLAQPGAAPARRRSLCAGRHPPSNCGAQRRGVSGATGRSGRAGRAASGELLRRPPLGKPGPRRLV